jgi:hypothetical protein
MKEVIFVKLFNKKFKADLCKELEQYRDRIEEWRAAPEDSKALYAYSAMYADEFIEPIADEEIKSERYKGSIVGALAGVAVSSLLFAFCGTFKRR